MSTLIGLILVLSATVQSIVPATLPAKEINSLIEAVDRKFDSMKDFSADFVQISTNPVNQTQEDRGHLYLTKDRKMKMDYATPEEKHFVSNGKTFYTYIPRSREVTREQVKDSTAEQIPLMFMVGRANLRKEFSQIRELTGKPFFEGDLAFRLAPKRRLEEILYIDIEVNPRTNLIDRMIIWESDKAKTDFIFLNILVNTNIASSMFEFKPPPGIRVVEGSAIQ
jgi:outer membrane lipoprotein carrier protein